MSTQSLQPLGASIFLKPAAPFKATVLCSTGRALYLVPSSEAGLFEGRASGEWALVAEPFLARYLGPANDTHRDS